VDYCREGLGTLKEDGLREKVLKPLFEAMGFKDVFLYHGGSLETGKDIVMWREDDFGIRRNWAVVAKATSISGSVTARSGAGEVRTQVEQCQGLGFIN